MTSERAKRRANTWYEVKQLLREVDALLTKPVLWAVVILPAALVVVVILLLAQALS